MALRTASGLLSRMSLISRNQLQSSSLNRNILAD